jgi:hypothetical protein
MVKRPLTASSLSMESLHTAVGGSSRIFLLFLIVSSLVQASTSTADSKCRYGVGVVVWGMPPSIISSTKAGKFGLPAKDKALRMRGGGSSEEDKFQLEEGDEDEDEIHPDEDEIVDIEVNELMDDEEEHIMEELEEDIPSEADGGVDDWAGDEDNADDNDDTVSVEPEKTWETPESSFSREAVMDDGDSSAFVDRMELADAYDEGETTSGGFEGENNGDGSGIDSVAPVGRSETQEEAQESTSSAVPEQQDSAAPAPPTEISAATKEILMNELKYRRSEVEKMRPDVAKIAADKRLQRPTEGVPVNWFVAGKVPRRKGQLNVLILVPVLVGTLVPVLFGAAAVLPGIYFGLGPSYVFPAKKPQPPQPSLFAEYETSKSAEGAVEVDDNYTKATEEPDSENEPDFLPVNEHVNAPSQVHAHSIKPGNLPADAMDVTWLDKGITAIERTIKDFLGWEI